MTSSDVSMVVVVISVWLGTGAADGATAAEEERLLLVGFCFLESAASTVPPAVLLVSAGLTSSNSV